MPFFSVIIPLYNKAKYIAACLEGVLNQDYKDFEIIIVNDGSTDASVAVVEGFSSDKIKLYHQENSGVSSARNHAVDKAEGNYLAFLDADDLWKPQHLQCLKESIEAFPDAGLYGNNYEINYNNSVVQPAQFNFNYATQPCIVTDFFKASMKDTIIWTSAAALSKTTFLDFRGFNTAYTTGQDLDLWIRIALEQAIVFHPQITMCYNRSISDSLSKGELNGVRFQFLNAYQTVEATNKSLKRYLDLKRYGLALRTKINGESTLSKQTQNTIDFSNLTKKQKLLLQMPTGLLRLLNTVRPYVVNNSIYLRLFKA